MKRTLFSLAVIGFVAAGIAGPANAYQCKALPKLASATYNLKIKARNEAVSNWTAKVKDQLGLPWSVWTIASAKNLSCGKSGSQWTCQAAAKPCLYVVQ